MEQDTKPHDRLLSHARSRVVELTGSTAERADPVAWSAFKDALYQKEWVVYAKPPFGGPKTVFRYLGRYTHRVALSNQRLTELGNGHVTFTVRNHADHARRKLLTLDAIEFLRRFLLHVLPKRLVRIRHYGLCAGRHVRGKLAVARRHLQPPGDAEPMPSPASASNDEPWWVRFRTLTGIDMMACPVCLTGRLLRTGPLRAVSTMVPEVRPPPETHGTTARSHCAFPTVLGARG